MTNVGQLKKELEQIPDETIVVTSGSDHSYHHVKAFIEQAELDQKTKEMWEYYDEGNKNKKSNKVIDVLVINM